MPHAPTHILTCDEVRAAEQAAAAHGVSLYELMRRAGQACADILHARHPFGRVIAPAGPGNNGGDAFIAASRLRDLARDVIVYELAPGGPRTEEGAAASTAWTGPRRPLAELKVEPGDIVLDGLFGAGLTRPLTGEAAAVAAHITASNVFVVAIDIPSGLNGDTGASTGSVLRAHDTVTFGAKKIAHVLYPAAELCGEVHVAEIGFASHFADLAGERLMENSPALWSHDLRWPSVSAHKHQRGRLAVVSGPLARTGAARLAAQAGLRSGAGLVTLLCPPGALMVIASSVTAVMTESFADADALVAATEKFDAVVIGPAAGANDATRANVEALGAAHRRLVLDADALTVFAGDAPGLRRMLNAEAVLTPHAGEFERVFPGLLAGARNRIEAARTAAAVSGAVVLLKGPDTIIAAPDGRAVVNTHATPFLATAGSGDVLAGVIGGLMAQGLPAFTAASAATWMHGDAGRRAGPGLTSEDLDAALRETIVACYAARAVTGL